MLATARLDRRTKNLTKRLKPGDIAIIDHIDLDRVAADALIRSQVAAVVNVAPSISGRYPNLGPQVLMEAGIPLVDDVGPGRLRPGQGGPAGQARRRDPVSGRCRGRQGHPADRRIGGAGHGRGEGRAGRAAQGVRQPTPSSTSTGTPNCWSRASGCPQLRTKLAGRHALVVARGYRYHEDLQALRAYIREFKPVIIGVDGGANALIEAGLLAAHDRRRHGLGLRQGAEVRRRDRRASPT